MHKHLDQPYLSFLENIKFKPIFILGSARSGTTILYKLLANTSCFNHLNAYHVVNYDRILFDYINHSQDKSHQDLNDLYADMGVKDRNFDHVSVDSNMPKEYRSIWQNQENLSPLQVVQEVLSKCLFKGRDLGQAICKAYQLDQENISTFIEACKKIQFIGDSRKQILLKNPWDFSNFIYIKERFPDAKFIFIHRHPLNILNSQLRVTQSTLGAKSNYLTIHSKLYSNLFRGSIIRVILSNLFVSPQLAEMRQALLTKIIASEENFFVENISKLQQTDYINVKYEDLCRQPNQIIADLLHFVGVCPSLNVDYSQLIQPRHLE
ncbi:MAG: sulfotransferase [Leptolyngbya sp. SIO3F4]|nr:sulfotransferase [Leptolyngbya sp. SIO3F4]